MYRALYVAAGKRGKKSLVVASNCNNSTGRLYVTDRFSKTSFLFDTGANLCVYPRSCLRERRTHSSYGVLQLTALPSVHYSASGFWPTAGVFMPICSRGCEGTNHRFRLPDILLVDVRRRRLIDVTTLTFNGDPVGTSGGQIKVLASSSRYHTTLLDIPEIIRPANEPRGPRHSTIHHIRTTPRPPAASRPRLLAPDTSGSLNLSLRRCYAGAPPGVPIALALCPST